MVIELHQVQEQLRGVTCLKATAWAFAAIREDGVLAHG